MGFRDDITKILDATPTERQTVFFSATMPPPIRELIKRYSRDPKTIRIEQKAVTVPTVEQWFYEVPYNRKVEALLRLIDYHAFKLGIIFCNTQRMVDELTDTLVAQGFSADRLHGGIPQAQRTRVMNKFKLAEFEFLVATDVAARGIDVDDLEVVVNYDLPYDSEDYVHRIGRTGRAGKRGMAMTFVSGRDIYKIAFIERYTRTRIRKGRMPTTGEVHEKRADALIQKVRTILGGTRFAAHTPLVDRLLEEGFSSTDIACALFQMVTGGSEPEAGPANAPSPTEGPAAKPAPRPPPVSPIPDDAPLRPAPRSAPRPATPRAAPMPAPRTTPALAPRAAPVAPPRPVPGPAPRAASAPAPRTATGPVAPRAAPGAAPRTVTPPAPIVPRHAPAAPGRDAEPMPLLRLAPRGSQWVRLSIGWRDQTSPRAIVGLLSSALGVPAPRVGMIEVGQTQAFAQVATEFLHVLENGPLKVDAESGPAAIELLPPKHRTDLKAKTYTKHKTP
jgi:ATP-dependent RNA helicase DeaD